MPAEKLRLKGARAPFGEASFVFDRKSSPNGECHFAEDRERTIDSPMDKVMLCLAAFADELERESAGQRTDDAMHRKASPCLHGVAVNH